MGHQSGSEVDCSLWLRKQQQQQEVQGYYGQVGDKFVADGDPTQDRLFRKVWGLNTPLGPLWNHMDVATRLSLFVQ